MVDINNNDNNDLNLGLGITDLGRSIKDSYEKLAILVLISINVLFNNLA